MPPAEQLEKIVGEHQYRAGLDKNLILIGDTLDLEGGEEVFETVDNLDVYDKRFLPISKEGDIVVLRKGGYDEAHLDYLNSVGFGTGKENIVLIDDGNTPVQDKQPIVDIIRNSGYRLLDIKEKMEEGKDYDIHSYHSSDKVMQIADLLDTGYTGTTSAMSRKFNNKIEFKEFVRDLGIEVSPGSVVYKDSVDDIVKQLEEGIKEHGNKGEVYVRGEFGASGSSAGKVNYRNLQRAAKAIHKDKSSDRFLLEPYHDLESSPSVIYRITNEGIHQLNPISGQILSKHEHEGNYYPFNMAPEDKAKLMNQAERVADAKRAEGYRGDDGYDFMKVKDGDIYFAENNARVTGAAPGAHLKGELEKKHGIPLYFSSVNLHTPINSFDELADAMHGYNCTGTLLYDGDRPSGVIPITAPSGGKAIMASFAPTLDEWKEVGRKMGDYGRDPKVVNYFK